MNRKNGFLIVFLASLAGIVAYVALSLSLGLGYSMAQAMQESYAGHYDLMVLYMVPPLFLFVMLVVGLAGWVGALGGQASRGSLASVYASLMPDEKLVVDCLLKHGGVCLQRDISREVGFTRLKTHRVVTRLQKRGIISVHPLGNTNEVMLASWLQGEGKAN